MTKHARLFACLLPLLFSNCNRAPTPAAPPTPPAPPRTVDLRIPLYKLAQAYHDNPAAADAAYRDKYIEFSALVRYPGHADRPNFLILSAAAYAEMTGVGDHVRCFVTPGDATWPDSLQDSQRVILRATCLGKSADPEFFLDFKDASLIKLAHQPSDAPPAAYPIAVAPAFLLNTRHTTACFSADGRSIFGSNEFAAPGGIDRWDADTGSNPARASPDNCMYFYPSPDGKQLAAYSGDGHEIILDAGTARTLHRFEWQSADPAWSPDASTLALPGDRIVRLIDSATGAQRSLIRLPDDCPLIGSIAWSPDGKRLVVTTARSIADQNMGIRMPILLCDVAAGSTQLLTITDSYKHWAFFTDDHTLIYPTANYVIQFDLTSQSEREPLIEQVRGGIERAILSPDRTRLITADSLGTLQLWNVPDACLRANLSIPGGTGPTATGPRGSVATICFSPDGRKIVVAYVFGGIALFNLP